MEVGAVIGPDVLAVGLLTFALGVVVGGLVDLVLSKVDVDLAGIVVDPVDDPGRQHAPFAEDPEAGIGDDVAPADVVGSGIEVADGAVRGDDLEADQVSGLRPGGVSPAPEVSYRAALRWYAHSTHLLMPSLPRTPHFQTAYSLPNQHGFGWGMASQNWCDISPGIPRSSA